MVLTKKNQQKLLTITLPLNFKVEQQLSHNLPVLRMSLLEKSKSAGMHPILMNISTHLCGPLKKMSPKLVTTELTSTLMPLQVRLVTTTELMLPVPSTTSRFLPKTIALMSNHLLVKLATLPFPLSPSALPKSSTATWKSHGTP